MDRAEEIRVIERAVAGDRQAAERLIREHQASLFAYILRLSGRREVAEDVVQDAFVRVLTNLQRFDPRFRFSTWLFTIAKRLYVNANQKLRPVYDSDTVGSAGGKLEEPITPAVERESMHAARTALDEALLTLTPDQREIVILFYQHEWPIAQIATHMGMPEGTIKSHLHRGRAKMRRAIESSEANDSLVNEYLHVWS
jgi:RNA polymerase sigma-70 factor (ECF subfamily)